MMTRTLSILALLAAVVGCGGDSAETSAVNKNLVIGGAVEPVAFNTGGLPTLSFDVPGMHCEVMCVPKVRETLAAQPGVEDVRVDLDTKTATVAINKDAFDAKQAIVALGMEEFEATLHEPGT